MPDKPQAAPPGQAPQPPPEPASSQSADQSSMGTVEDLGNFAKNKYPQYKSVPAVELGKLLKQKYPQMYGKFADMPAGSPPATPNEKPGFWANAWQASGIPGIPKLMHTASLLNPSNPSGWAEGAKEVKEGIIDPQLEMFSKSGDALKQGNLVDWVGYSMAGALPGAGPNIMHGYEQMKEGDVKGGLGTWAGTLIPFALGEGASGMAKTLSRAAPKIYEGAMQFPEGVSLSERSEAANRGVGRSEPPGAPPKSRIIASKEGLKQLQSRIDKDHAEVIGRIAKVTSHGIDVDRDYVLAKIDDFSDRIENSGDPESAKSLREMADTFRKNNPQFISPDRLQELKQNTDLLLKNPAFAENAKLTGKSAGLMAMRDGMREILEQVAPIQQLNWANHLDYQLSDAINHVLKTKPSVYYRAMPGVLVAGGMAAGAFGRAHYAEAIITAGIVRQLMNSPTAMTRIAAMLDEGGIAVPAAIKASRAGIPLSQASQGGDQRGQINIQVNNIMDELMGLPSNAASELAHGTPGYQATQTPSQ